MITEFKKKIVSPLLEEFFYKRGYDERATTAISVDEVFDAVMAQLEATAPSRQRGNGKMTQRRNRRSEIGDQRTERPRSPRGSRQKSARQSVTSSVRQTLRVALLTGGGDKPYALGMAAALTSVGISR